MKITASGRDGWAGGISNSKCPEYHVFQCHHSQNKSKNKNKCKNKCGMNKDGDRDGDSNRGYIGIVIVMMEWV